MTKNSMNSRKQRPKASRAKKRKTMRKLKMRGGVSQPSLVANSKSGNMKKVRQMQRDKKRALKAMIEAVPDARSMLGLDDGAMADGAVGVAKAIKAASVPKASAAAAASSSSSSGSRMGDESKQDVAAAPRPSAKKASKAAAAAAGMSD